MQNLGKYALHTICACLIALLINCGGDDEPNIKNQLIGSWRAHNGTVKGCDDFEDTRPTKDYRECPTPSSGICLEYIFRDDGSVTFGIKPSNSTYLEYDGTFTVNGHSVTMSFAGLSGDTEVKVTFDEEEMIMVEGPFSNQCVKTDYFNSF